MWHELKIEKVSKIEKCVGEFDVWMHGYLPYGKMKVKIYEQQDKTYEGKTDISIKRKFDGQPECAVGYGKTVEETLADTIEWLKNMIEEDYPKGIDAVHIEYSEYSDF